jgi:beta-galactosidase/beta-glucuronidase
VLDRAVPNQQQLLVGTRDRVDVLLRLDYSLRVDWGSHAVEYGIWLVFGLFGSISFSGCVLPVVLYSVPQTHIEDITVVTGIDGADTMAGMHGHPNVMWTEEYQAEYMRGHLEVAGRKEYVAGMQVWNFADFAAVQSIMRVGGLNMKGIFTRTHSPKMAAHVLREFWVKK